MQTKIREYHNAQSNRGERRQECELSLGSREREERWTKICARTLTQ